MIPNGLKHTKSKILFYTTEKSDCTEVTLYFFAMTNLLNVALRFSPWIHDYQWAKYVPKNKVELSDLLGKGRLYRIKFVRCPYDRAVSIYRHYHRKLNMKANFTFGEFLKYLEETYFTLERLHSDANPHLLTQSFPEECSQNVIWDAVVHVENLVEELTKLENHLPKRVDLCKKRVQSCVEELKETHWVKRKVVKTGTDVSKIRYQELCFWKINYADMYVNPEVRSLVEKLYRLDFECHPEYTFEKFVERS
jgi:hypothetical protein